jgi:small conductance mechanosensitive channel
MPALPGENRTGELIMPTPEDLTETANQDILAWLTSFSTEDLPILLGRLIFSIILFLIGRYVVSVLARFLRGSLEKRKVDALTTEFLVKTVTIIGLIIVGIIALGNLGIPMTSLIAFMGAGAIAIALALQDSLSNLASGLLIILLHPYKDEDSVEVGENRLTGSVDTVRFFHTILRTPDNSRLLVPNSEVMGNPIINFTDLGWRRIDLEFSIGYDDDLRRAKQILEELVASDPRIRKDPPTTIAVNALSENGVDLIFQPHVHPADYATVKYDLNEQVKMRFDEAGITMAVPQRTIRLVQ